MSLSPLLRQFGTTCFLPFDQWESLLSHYSCRSLSHTHCVPVNFLLTDSRELKEDLGTGCVYMPF